jgi:tyrosyl-tRNA synthetase
MLAKESVDRRIQTEEGISFTEFSYLLLQAYDFLVLHDRYHCTLQLGGSDQWGNITAGCELIRRVRGEKAHGLVLPLVTTASGSKFGKTEAGTVWLAQALTSPFRFYQFWLNADDRDAVQYLKFFTFLSRDEIDALEQATGRTPEARDAQRVLAREVTRLVHGENERARAERATAVLFGGALSDVTADEVLEVFADVPSTEIPAADVGGGGVSLVDLLARVKLAPSKSEATRLIRSGGVYVNNERVADEKARLTLDRAIAGRLFVLRKGQRQNHLVKIAAG